MPTRTTRTSLADALRARMRSGAYPPGSRLPSRRELMTEFGTSSATLQKAFDRLAAQGYVTTVAKHGAYVADRLPESSCYGLVVGHPPAAPVRNRFWGTLSRLAGTWDDGSGRRFDRYFIAEAGDAEEDLRRLRADVADGRLAGLVFASIPYHLLDRPAASLLSANIPRVCFGGDPAETRIYRASVIKPVDDQAIEETFAWFAARGRRRIAGITSPPRAAAWRAHLPALHRAGLETRDTWWLGFPPSAEVADVVRVATRLLFDRRPTERPDALLIDDDNLVPWVTAGLAQSGLDLPASLSIAAHANVPGATPAAVPCRRYGFDARQLLTAAIEELDHLRQGHAPRLLPVQACFLGGDDAGKA